MYRINSDKRTVGRARIADPRSTSPGRRSWLTLARFERCPRRHPLGSAYRRPLGRLARTLPALLPARALAGTGSGRSRHEHRGAPGNARGGGRPDGRRGAWAVTQRRGIQLMRRTRGSGGNEKASRVPVPAVQFSPAVKRAQAPTCTSTDARGTGRMPRISSAARAAACSLSLMELPSPVATSRPSTETPEAKLGRCAGPCFEITR